jgi:hypothetical protein
MRTLPTGGFEVNVFQGRSSCRDEGGAMCILGVD